MKTVLMLLFILLFSIPLKSQENLVFSQPDDPVADISMLILKEAYSRIGISITSTTMPAERSLISSNTGFTDGEVGRIEGIDEEFTNLLMVPVPINIIEGVVFSKNFSFPVSGWESLESYLMGYRNGTKFVENETEGMNTDIVTTNEQLLLKLNLERNDIAVLSRIEGLTIIKKFRLESIKILEPPLVTLELYHYLHKKYETLIPVITNELVQMKEEGRIDELRNLAISELFEL